MWKIYTAAIILAANAMAALAAEAPTPSPPPELVKAITDWSTCRSTKVGEWISEPRSAESIVDQAFYECRDFEREAIRLWETQFGPKSGGQVIELKDRWRRNLIDSATSIRMGAPITNNFSAWGHCVGVNIPEKISPDLTSSSIADAAMEKCLPEFERVRTEYEKSDPSSAAANLNVIVTEIRNRAISQIENSRQPQ